MHRDRTERELSLHLDGRLPAARRDALVERLFEDDDTARLQAEMERAQELALSLPRERVGAAFSETLWQRIRAGEGKNRCRGEIAPELLNGGQSGMIPFTLCRVDGGTEGTSGQEAVNCFCVRIARNLHRTP